jgi:hypothetical protein
MIFKNRKLKREERILVLKEALNIISNSRYLIFDRDNDRDRKNIKIGPYKIYSWWTVFWDIIIGLNIRK